MSKNHQKTSRRDGPDPPLGEVMVPEQVAVSLAEIAESAREGLLALSVGVGLRVISVMSEDDAVSGVSRQ